MNKKTHLRIIVYLSIFVLILGSLIFSWFWNPRAWAIAISKTVDPFCGDSIYLPLTTNNYSTWETEPNNSFSLANGPLHSGESFFGYINDEKDIFYFDTDSDGPISVDLSQYTGQGGQLILYYESVDNVVSRDVNPPFHIDVNSPAGRYFVFIFNESGFSTTTPYNILTTYPLPNQPILFFSDNFCGQTIDSQKWVTNTEILTVHDGSLHIPPTLNSGSAFDFQKLEAILNNTRFSIVEFKSKLDGGGNGTMGFNTSCSSDPALDGMVFELNANDRAFKGSYGDDAIELPGPKSIVLGQEYVVRLEQDGSFVRTFIDGKEVFDQPFPCELMGEWFSFGAGRNPGGYVEGSFDYVKLWASP